MSATSDLRFEPDRERDSVAYALGVLRRRWLVVVAAIAICLAAGVVIAGLNSDKRYESSARVLFGTSSLSPVEWVAGSVSAVVAYVLALRLLGELSRDDIALARRAVRGVLVALGRRGRREP